jgi:predicted  nucleic acid-binding Zn-ribbon protein
MEELRYEIEALEEKIEDMEAQLDEATSPEEAEELASMITLYQEDLEQLREDYEEQREYEGMNAWEYNGVSQKDFY